LRAARTVLVVSLLKSMHYKKKVDENIEYFHIVEWANVFA
jgi:hypothetical protein